MGLLLLVHLRVLLVNSGSERGGVSSEGDVKRLEEPVASGEQRLGSSGKGLDGRSSVKDNDSVGQISGHDEIVLDEEGAQSRRLT